VTPLLRRVLTEKRKLLLPLVVTLAANVLAYVIVVRPLGVRSAGAASRASEAAAALRGAAKELEMARALVTGKAQADEELSAFYQKVLPTDLVAARRMTYATLPALARRTNVRYEARSTEVEDVGEDERLGHMTIRMILQGDYEDIVQFIYQLESAPEFVIIDDVTLTEGTANEPQTLALNLSTYYRLRPNGT
jgi:Tfp pilus assembly protein PilO